MIDNLTLEGSNKTPEVKFNGNTGTLEISGKSIPENSFGFYQPLMTWLDSYIAAPQPQTTINISLEYFNTSSSKCLLDLFRKLSALKNSGKSQVKVLWHHEEDDEDMMEAGQDYSSLVDIPFEIIKI